MADDDDIEIAIKVIIVGNGAVGKSSLIQRYCKGIFTRDYKKTIGVDFLERELEYNGETVRLMIWDTAGQEEFDAITKTYYRGAQACVLAFSSTDIESFKAVASWKQKVEAEVGAIPMVLVQNKIDINDGLISDLEVKETAKSLELKLYKTSVKENLNVEAVFQHLIQSYISHLSLQMTVQSTKTSIGPNLTANHSRSSNRSFNNSLMMAVNEKETELSSPNSRDKKQSRPEKSSQGRDNTKRRDKCVIS